MLNQMRNKETMFEDTNQEHLTNEEKGQLEWFVKEDDRITIIFKDGDDYWYNLEIKKKEEEEEIVSSSLLISMDGNDKFIGI